MEYSNQTGMDSMKTRINIASGCYNSVQSAKITLGEKQFEGFTLQYSFLLTNFENSKTSLQ